MQEPNSQNKGKKKPPNPPLIPVAVAGSAPQIKFKPKPNPKPNDASKSKLRNVVKNLYLLPRLERRETQIRTPITAERITQRAAAARACLALHREIELVQIIRLQLQHVQIGVCLLTPLFVLCFQPVC